MILNMTWQDFKEKLNAGFVFRYIDVGDVYYLISNFDLIELNCVIPQNGSADQTDFETNYKSDGVNYNLSPLAPGFYRNITGNSTTVVKSGAGVLMGIWINNNSTGGSTTIYDSTSESGSKIASISVGNLSLTDLFGPNAFTALNVRFTTGLTVVTSGSTSNDITIVYR